MGGVVLNFHWKMAALLNVIPIRNIGAALNLVFVEARKSIAFVMLVSITGLFHSWVEMAKCAVTGGADLSFLWKMEVLLNVMATVPISVAPLLAIAVLKTIVERILGPKMVKQI